MRKLLFAVLTGVLVLGGTPVASAQDAENPTPEQVFPEIPPGVQSCITAGIEAFSAGTDAQLVLRDVFACLGEELARAQPDESADTEDTDEPDMTGDFEETETSEPADNDGDDAGTFSTGGSGSFTATAEDAEALQEAAADIQSSLRDFTANAEGMLEARTAARRFAGSFTGNARTNARGFGSLPDGFDFDLR